MSENKSDIILWEIRQLRKDMKDMNKRQTKSEIKNAKSSSFFGGLTGMIVALITKLFM